MDKEDWCAIWVNNLNEIYSHIVKETENTERSDSNLYS
jgi:hypothetical protein